MSAESLDINAIRERLQQAGGPQYWRSLESVAETPEFQEFLHREFPSNASEFTDPVGRRGFLKLMSASVALAGVSACTVQPTELIVPYVRQPEEIIPGKALFFATAMTLGGVATGLLVESHEGRPTKVEGNPDHPGSLGATDLFAQASVLTLYDPDRSQSIVAAGRDSSLEHVRHRGEVGALEPGRGQGRRSAHPHRDGELADARASDSAAAGAVSRSKVDSVGGAARPVARRRPPRLRRAGRAAVRLQQGRRRALARRRLPRLGRRRQPALLAPVLVAPPRRRQRRQPESPVRGRSRALGDGRQGRSPRGAEVQPHRCLCPRRRGEAGRVRRVRRGPGRQRSLD